MIKIGRIFWAYIGRRDYGYRPGCSFGFVLFPRPDEVDEVTLIPGLLRMDGWIDWVTFETTWAA